MPYQKIRALFGVVEEVYEHRPFTGFKAMRMVPAQAVAPEPEMSSSRLERISKAQTVRFRRNNDILRPIDEQHRNLCLGNRRRPRRGEYAVIGTKLSFTVSGDVADATQASGSSPVT